MFHVRVEWERLIRSSSKPTDIHDVAFESVFYWLFLLPDRRKSFCSYWRKNVLSFCKSLFSSQSIYSNVIEFRRDITIGAACETVFKYSNKFDAFAIELNFIGICFTFTLFEHWIVAFSFSAFSNVIKFLLLVLNFYHQSNAHYSQETRHNLFRHLWTKFNQLSHIQI